MQCGWLLEFVTFLVLVPGVACFAMKTRHRRRSWRLCLMQRMRELKATRAATMHLARVPPKPPARPKMSKRVKIDLGWTKPELTQDGRTCDAGEAFSFGFRSSCLSLSSDAREQMIRFCRVIFSQGHSFWQPASEEPRCLPERIAAEVFARYTCGASFDARRSGAEWWAQVRHKTLTKPEIQFHWDADEFAVEQHNALVHPHLATVTYLTDVGAPTLVVDRRNLTGKADAAAGVISKGMLSYPQVGRHVVFDGQLLHGAVLGHGSSGERISFLVNIWLDHRPSMCKPLSSSLSMHLGDASCRAVLAEPEPLPIMKLRTGRDFHSRFAWRSQLHELRVILPEGDKLAHELCWEDGAELRGIADV